MTLRCCLRLAAGCALPCLVLAGCIAGSVPGSAGATPTPQIRSTVAVKVGPVEVETTPVPAVSRKAVAARPVPTATRRYVHGAPHAPPKILAIKLSTVNVTGGDTVSGVVETTSNVASVEARISGWSMSVPRTRIGHFEASGQIPDLPIFAKGTYTLEVIARNADGVKAERDIPITFR